MDKYKVVGLFSGCGGLDLGFIQSGFEVVWANDFEKDAVKTYKKNNQNLNEVSKSSAAHSTLTINDNSSCKFTKRKDKLILKTGLKITQKSSVCEKNYWKINAAHDGYFKRFKSIHERNIEFFPEQMKFVGNDKIIRKKNQQLF